MSPPDFELFDVLLLAVPVDPGTTLTAFTKPVPQPQGYGYERTPQGQPQEIKVDGRAALLKRFLVRSMAKDYEAHDLRLVADGVGFTLQILVPIKKAADGRRLLQVMQRSWKMR